MVEVTLMKMERLSIILHDGSDASASITVKEDFYEAGKIHRRTCCGSIGAVGKAKVCGKHARWLSKNIPSVGEICGQCGRNGLFRESGQPILTGELCV